VKGPRAEAVLILNLVTDKRDGVMIAVSDLSRIESVIRA
jgi:hypothetical protein